MSWRVLKVGLLLAVSGCAGPYMDPLPRDAEHHRVLTRDGWELELVRYAAQGEVRGRPVLLCHGISANARNMDLDARHSMARWFAAHGREAWTVSLRPNGRFVGEGGGKGEGALPRPGYDFDALADEDLAAAVEHVRKLSRAPVIDYVGHSMGGMVLYAYLGSGGTGIGAGVVLGSPARLDFGGVADSLLPQAARALHRGWILPVPGPVSIIIPLEGMTEGGFNELLLYNPENTTVPTFQRLMAMGMADVSVGLLQQLAELIRTGRFHSASGQRDYRRLLAQVTTPVLVVAGKRDRLATVPAVKAGYQALGGPKEWRLIGVETGARADYAHMDLVLGERAPEEVWPLVLDFLDRHAGHR
jgi:alpha-beta hydrolase superfamily lysophospholipase